MKNKCKSIFEGFSEVEYGSGSVRLREYLLERGISLDELGAKAHIDPSIIKRYCADTMTNVSLDILGKICYSLECEMSDILVYDKTGAKRKRNTKKNEDSLE